MGMSPIIEIKGLGKKYILKHQRGGYRTLRDGLSGAALRQWQFLGRQAKLASRSETREEFWALRGVDLRINRGDIIGVIGSNGAGKSTLLKVVTGITPPSEGEAIRHGRVASFLEVGTGVHPEE